MFCKIDYFNISWPLLDATERCQRRRWGYWLGCRLGICWQSVFGVGRKGERSV